VVLAIKAPQISYQTRKV